ncbi:hypothetical protein [Mycoplasma seminis]|uniref:Uncharacterized protein n=1 Tax=Mycoplasma seminis TaxID=512749 RepID=A0ABY9HAI4_9MOLU|nr:hypothetical protein [Mycoplasma seminis]WLP85613.1 hypothetical protein Q8852_00390 [Mycoplasma seminis]
MVKHFKRLKADFRQYLLIAFVSEIVFAVVYILTAIINAAVVVNANLPSGHAFTHFSEFPIGAAAVLIILYIVVIVAVILALVFGIKAAIAANHLSKHFAQFSFHVASKSNVTQPQLIKISNTISELQKLFVLTLLSLFLGFILTAVVVGTYQKILVRAELLMVELEVVENPEQPELLSEQK